MRIIVRLLVLAFVAFLPTTHSAAASGAVTLGLNGMAYWALPHVLNWWKMPGKKIVHTVGGEISAADAFRKGYLDQDGNLRAPVPAEVVAISSLIWAGSPTPTLEGEAIEITWQGSGNCVIDWAPTAHRIAANHVVFTFGKDPGNTRVRCVVTDRNNPPMNQLVYQQRYARNVAAGQKFNPDWLVHVKDFGALRYMDLMGTNGSTITDYEQIADEAYFNWGGGRGTEPKGGYPISLICEAANLTSTDVWFNFPFSITDDGARKIVRALKKCTERRVHYEYSNEVWNWGFQQAQDNLKLAQADPRFRGGYAKRYGYRAAQLMKIVRDEYGDTSRWNGELGTHTEWPENVTVEGIKGVKLAISEGGWPLQVKDLFRGIAVTGYIGATPQGDWIQEITATDPMVVKVGSVTFKPGDRVRMNLKRLDGVELPANLAALHDKSFVVKAKIDEQHFSLAAEGPRLQSTWIPVEGSLAYIVQADLFDAMDKGHATFSTAYIDKILANIKADVAWPKNVAYAKAEGLEVHQYEGGRATSSGLFAAHAGGRGNDLGDRWLAFVTPVSWAPEMAVAYKLSFDQYRRAGGTYPAQFVDTGYPSIYGNWGLWRYPPIVQAPKGDYDNPVSRAVLDETQRGAGAAASPAPRQNPAR